MTTHVLATDGTRLTLDGKLFPLTGVSLCNALYNPMFKRKRKYRHPGQCPLAVAGVPPGDVSCLDALGI